ncbi:unnamed protein product [Ambrosiozyma monospora]|uniref:Unnamed protein product n=1 Tax=Ambrosiozyma monospora TaxID=43982 RepID=A0A9W7DDB2_AMBMO|nr:unnamed protein product [Ambrosiozyma monospora]
METDILAESVKHNTNNNNNNNITTMDSLDARLNFSKKLSVLQPSRQASQELATLLIRRADLKDDLYPVIMETLDSVDLNIRVNIFGFIEELINLDIERVYLRSLISDLPIIMVKLLPRKEQHQGANSLADDPHRLLMNIHSYGFE